MNLPEYLIYIVVPCMISTSCSNPQKPAAIDTVWQFQSQREEIEPSHWVDADVQFDDQPTLAISGDGKAYINGSWTNAYDIDPGKYYKFITHFKPENVLQLNRSILAQIIWQSKDGKQVDFIEYPATRGKSIRWGLVYYSTKLPGAEGSGES